MLVADVAAGNALVTTEKYFPKMARPPVGYDSVVGEVGLLMIATARGWVRVGRGDFCRNAFSKVILWQTRTAIVVLGSID